MAREISNSEDIIDSRDVIERIDELEDMVDDLQEQIEAADEEENNADNMLSLRIELDEVQEELEPLRGLQEETEGYAPDWRHGEALIRDSYFTEYAQQLAEDIGAVNSDAGWPNNLIDWERAAEELQMDYTSVDFDGVTYWIR